MRSSVFKYMSRSGRANPPVEITAICCVGLAKSALDPNPNNGVDIHWLGLGRTVATSCRWGRNAGRCSRVTAAMRASSGASAATPFASIAASSMHAA